MRAFAKEQLPVLWTLLAALALGFVGNSTSLYIQQLLILAGINILLANGLNLISGITGQLSLGHAGFMSVGAYVSASLSLRFGQPGLFLPILLAGGIAAGLLGALVGLPTLRLKGDYLAIVTLGFNEVIRVVFLNLEAIGGARGLPQIPQRTSLMLVILCVAWTLLSIYRWMHSYFGRAFLAIREDEIAAQAIGISTTQYKTLAFSIGAFLAGIAGGLFAHQLTYINPAIFSFTKSFEVLTMLVLGGLGSLSGCTLAAIALTFLPEALRPLQQWTHVDFRMVIYSTVLIVLMLTRPKGLLGKKELWEFLPKKKGVA